MKQGARLGHKSVFLIGDDIGSWGVDLGLAFPDLLEAVVALVPDVRLRIDYLHPKHFLGFYDAVHDFARRGSIEFTCLPIQHTNPRILSR